MVFSLFSRQRANRPPPRTPPGQRIYAIGDIHGRFDLHEALIDQIVADAASSASADCVLVYLGDYVDRGPQSDRLIETLAGPPPHGFRAHYLMGNHEDLMINSLIHDKDGDVWANNGGMWHFNEDVNELRALAGRAEELPIAITIATINGHAGICHAQPPSLNWGNAREPSDRDIQIMLWSRSWVENEAWGDVEGAYITVHGHTIVDHPVKLGNALFIDTGAFHTGNLVCMEL